MNHLQVFYETRILNTGFLARLGNLFLAPAQILFIPSKKILIKDYNSIAKVKAFKGPLISESWEPKPQSRQDEKLYGISLAGTGETGVLISLVLLAIFVPFTIIGTIFKLFSYLSPKVRENHYLVKDRLTPKNIELKVDDQDVDLKNLKQDLTKCLKTGQKVAAFTISGNKQLDADCLEIIQNINPRKLILNGVKIDTSSPKLENIPEKMRPLIDRSIIDNPENDTATVAYQYGDGYHWDTSALQLGNPKGKRPKTIVSSLEEAMQYKYKPGFFAHQKHVLIIIEPTLPDPMSDFFELNKEMR